MFEKETGRELKRAKRSFTSPAQEMSVVHTIHRLTARTLRNTLSSAESHFNRDADKLNTTQKEEWTIFFLMFFHC